MVKSLLDLGRKLGDLFAEVASAGLDLIKTVARAAARAGEALVEFTKYIATAAADAVKKVLDGLLEAGKLLIDVIKTVATRFQELEMRLKSLHPYEVPEIIALPIAKGSSDYLSWLRTALS